MALSTLNDTLLHLLARTRGKTVKDKIHNFGSIFFFLGSFLIFSGVLSAAFMILSLPAAPLPDSEYLDKGFKISCFFLAIFVGMSLFVFSFWIENYLKKIVEKNATIKTNKLKEKEIYNVNSDIDLSIYTHDRLSDDAGIFTKESFPHVKLEYFKIKSEHFNEKIIIKVRKGEQERTIDGGIAKFLVRNEEEIKNEIATWNVSEEVLIYKIEEVNIISELIEKDYKPLPICELEENVQTKIVLTASIDKERVKQIYDKRELDELLTFSPS